MAFERIPEKRRGSRHGSRRNHREGLGLAGRAARPRADGVVAIGGASPMDTAKASAVAFANPGDVRDYAGDNQVSPGVLNAGPHVFNSP
ncbi:MAG: iron-containing alcohol dehydrogenase [Solirubrobacteraceae bacterium]